MTAEGFAEGTWDWDVIVAIEPVEPRFEGSYIDDLRDGHFVEKDRNGNITAEGNYERGHRQVVNN